VSGDGSVVVGTAENADFDETAFRWTRDVGMQPLTNDLGGTRSDGTAISDDGLVTAGGATGENSRQRAFRQVGLGPMQDLGVTTGQTAFGIGISGNGQTVVGWATDESAQPRPMRWTTNTGMMDLGTFGGSRGMATDASFDGSVVVGWAREESGTPVAFRWTSGGLARLSGIDGSSEANAVSADGRVVVGTHLGAAFRWVLNQGPQTLGNLPDVTDSVALDVSDDGNIVVGRMNGESQVASAFLWTPAKGLQDLNVLFRDLLPEGYRLGSAQGISANGRYIVGVAENREGDDEAFLIGPIPQG
jgi:probable HAF family extracellular repeat protein